MKRITGLSKLLSIIMLFSLLLSIVGCAVPPPGNEKPEDEKYTVMVSCSDGVSVTSTNPLSVKKGESAEFDVAFENGYIYKSSEGATYDSTTGKLTVSSVSKNTNIDLIAEEVGYDTSAKYKVILYRFDALDSATVTSGSEVNAGMVITVKANNLDKKFLGWTIKAVSGYASTSREFSFVAKPEYAENGTIMITPSYTDKAALYYDLNGGTLNTSSENYTATEYYTVKKEGARVKVVHKDRYFDVVECPFSFFDDNTFTRSGYVLREYNTKPDGTGIAYSLGSMIAPESDGSFPTLYCIWEKETRSALFTYETVTIQRPSKISAESAPLWVEEGVKITCYTGDESKVVIPEKLGGKYVVSIAEGAFTNKTLDTLVMNKRLLTVEDGAFVGCDELETIYFSDNIYSMKDEALDKASYSSLKNVYVNACMAPRHSLNWGFFAIKLSRLLASAELDRIIVIAGSSSYQGLGTEYLEALLDGEYRVVNFGTTRTTNGTIYLEAMGKLAHDGDVVLYAPENSSYMLGESELYWKTLRDMESMLNVWRCIDVSNYTGFFDAYSDFNNSTDHGRYYRSANSPEQMCEMCYKSSEGMNKYGDYLNDKRKVYCNDNNYTDTYLITLNEYVKSKNEGDWNDKEQNNHLDYSNDTLYWCKITDNQYKSLVNKAIDKAKSSGAKVLFTFAPSDASKLAEGAQSAAWLDAYETLILDTYNFDGILGSVEDYIYDHKYFYNCAFHTNDYGRTYRTYRMYADLSELLEISDLKDMYDCGTEFSGCLFEEGSEDGYPVTSWTPEE